MASKLGSYMCEGQNAAPGETTKVKSHTLLNSRRHLGVMRSGITTMWVKSAASAMAGAGDHK
jgi:hypothetical protein